MSDFVTTESNNVGLGAGILYLLCGAFMCFMLLVFAVGILMAAV